MSSAATSGPQGNPAASSDHGGLLPLDDLQVLHGGCTIVVVIDIGFAIDLDEAESRVHAAKQRESIRRTRKAPQYFQYHPPPLRVTLPSKSVTVGSHQTQPDVDMVIYDFGAVTVIYRVPFSGRFAEMRRLGAALYENDELLADSKSRVEQLVATIGPSITKPSISSLVEDYILFHIEESTPAIRGETVPVEFAEGMAQLLQAESEPLSGQEIAETLACRISFSPKDLIIVDWNAAMLFGAEMEDVVAVLEFANVELLELRFLDDQLDRSLAEAYRLFSQRNWRRAWTVRPGAAALQRIARLQLDSAILFEGVNNTLKLLGEPYLARVYRLAAQRLHLSDWDASILRKLKTLDSLYEKISDQQSSWRMEVLEWIIILLIAVSILVSFK